MRFVIPGGVLVVGLLALSGLGVLMLIVSTLASTVAATPTNSRVQGQLPYTNLNTATPSLGLVTSDEIVTVAGFRVHASISDQVKALVAHARRDGIVFGGWAWRSHTRQHELRRINGCPDGWTHRPGESLSDFAPSSRCRVPTARPGSSLHETGLAIDFTCNGAPIAGTECFDWLKANAATYGLYNLASEPWHWSTTGR